jgi:hypothetical protein
VTESEDPKPSEAPAHHDRYPEHIMQFFEYAHLPAPLQQTSERFAKLADWAVHNLPRNAERTVALRKLLEAKDAAVRAQLAK